MPPETPEQSLVAARSAAIDGAFGRATAWALIAIAEELIEIRREVRHARTSASREMRRG